MAVKTHTVLRYVLGKADFGEEVVSFGEGRFQQHGAARALKNFRLEHRYFNHLTTPLIGILHTFNGLMLP